MDWILQLPLIYLICFNSSADAFFIYLEITDLSLENNSDICSRFSHTVSSFKFTSNFTPWFSNKIISFLFIIYFSISKRRSIFTSSSSYLTANSLLFSTILHIKSTTLSIPIESLFTQIS